MTNPLEHDMLAVRAMLPHVPNSNEMRMALLDQRLAGSHQEAQTRFVTPLLHVLAELEELPEPVASSPVSLERIPDILRVVVIAQQAAAKRKFIKRGYFVE